MQDRDRWKLNPYMQTIPKSREARNLTGRGWWSASLTTSWETEREKEEIDCLRWLRPLPLHICLLTGHTHRSTWAGPNNIWAILILDDPYISLYAQQRHLFFLGFLYLSPSFFPRNICMPRFFIMITMFSNLLKNTTMPTLLSHHSAHIFKLNIFMLCKVSHFLVYYLTT